MIPPEVSKLAFLFRNLELIKDSDDRTYMSNLKVWLKPESVAQRDAVMSRAKDINRIYAVVVEPERWRRATAEKP